MRAVVVGAGPAGLAAAACLEGAGFAVALLDRERAVGSAWRRHYDRLHLHTPKERSGLPGLPMPRDYPWYPAREQVVAYLERYAEHHGLAPRLGVAVERVERCAEGWRVAHSEGDERAEVVVLATGQNARPHRPTWPGMEGFPGPVLHARDYRRPDDLPGARVLVVGFGNSGGEIALDLAEAGRTVDLAVRSPVNILPRELLGRPVVSWDLLGRVLPAAWADALTAPILRMALGGHAAHGLRRPALGPLGQVVATGRVPVIDVGALAAIREGRITVRPGPERFEGAGVVFEGGARAPYDAVLLATGYRVDLRGLLPDVPGVLDEAGRPRTRGAEPAAPGLYLMGYHTHPRGHFLSMRVDAAAIAAHAARAARAPAAA